MKSIPPIVLAAAIICISGCAKKPDIAHSLQLEQRISILRDAYAAFNRGDIDAAVQSLDPNIDWSEPAEFPGGGSYHGRDAAKQYLSNSRNSVAEVTSEPEQFMVAGDRIVVFVYARVRPKNSTTWQEVRLADVYLFRNLTPIQMRAFSDRHAALQWANSSPATDPHL